MQSEDGRVKSARRHPVIVDGNAGQGAIGGKTTYSRKADSNKESKPRGGAEATRRTFSFAELRAAQMSLLHKYSKLLRDSSRYEVRVRLYQIY